MLIDCALVRSNFQLNLCKHLNDSESTLSEPSTIASAVDDVWSEDTEFPREDWRLDVQNCDTSLGYWDWVNSQREATQDMRREECL